MIIRYLGLNVFSAFFSFNLAAQQNAVKPIKLGWDFFKNNKPVADAQALYNYNFKL